MKKSFVLTDRGTLNSKDEELVWSELVYIGVLGASFLRKSGFFRSRGIQAIDIKQLSPGFVADVGGLACIILWLRRGLITFLRQEDRIALAKAIREFFGKREEEKEAVLALTVVVAWWNNFAREGRQRLGAEIVFHAEPPTDEELDALCEFLWENRNDGVLQQRPGS
ncbi:MAG: hypothetical protein HY291_00780 [Planctomycetes bacterium]|nr:hypothetical protein [Planctomycetota bacterium]